MPGLAYSSVRSLSRGLAGTSSGVPSRALLRQLMFRHTSPTLSGVIADETPGRGTDRPELIGRCVKPDGGNDYATANFESTGNYWSISLWVNSSQSGVSYLVDQSSPRRVLAWNSATPNQLGFYDGSVWHEFASAPADGQWHLLTLVVSNTAAKLYIDGLQSGSDKVVSAGALSGVKYLFRSQSDSAHFTGKVFDLQFFNSALTASEVYQLYSLCEFALPNTPRLAWYNCESQHPTLLLDSSGNNRNATCSSHNATVGNFFYQGNDVPGSYLNKVGYGQYLILTRTGTSWAGGVYGTEWISGEFDMQIVANATALAEQFLGFTTSTTDLTAATYNGTNLAFHITGAGTYVRVDGTPVGASGGVMVAGDVARITRDSNGLVSFYLNDTLLHSLTDTRSVRVIGTTTLTGYSFPLSLTIGGAWANLSRLRTSGPSYNVVNYSRKESDKTKDILGSPLQYIGEAPRHAKIENNNCGTFDGSNDSVILPGSVIGDISAADFAVTLKVRTTKTTIQTFFAASGASTDFEQALLVGNITNPGDLTLRIKGVNFTATGTNINDGNWHTVAGRRQGTSASLFLDGVQIASGTIASNPTAATPYVTIGSNNNGAAPTTTQVVSGSICNFQFLTGTVTSSQILAIHQNNISDKAPSAWLPFSEGKGTAVHNVVPGGAHGAASGIDELLYWGTKQNVFAYNSAMGSSFRGNLYAASTLENSFTAKGNQPPVAAFEVKDGKPSYKVTWNTSITDTGYAGSRADTIGGATASVVSGRTYSIRAKIKASRNLVGLEAFSIYFTGATVINGYTIRSTDIIDGDWLTVTTAGNAASLSGGLFFVVYKNMAGAFSSDITVWVSEVEVIEGTFSGIDSYAPTSGTAIPHVTRPARNDGSGLDALGNPLTYAPSPGVWPLSEATLNSNPNNAPRRDWSLPVNYARSNVSTWIAVSGASVVLTDETSLIGDKSVYRVSGIDLAAGIRVQNTVVPPGMNRNFTGSVYLKGEGSNIGKEVNVTASRDIGGSYTGQSTVHVLTSDWVRVSATFLGSADNTSHRLTLDRAGTNFASSCLVMMPQYEVGTSPGPYMPSNYNPNDPSDFTPNPPELLQYNSEFDNAYWVNYRLGVTSNAVADPISGALIADKLTPDTTPNSTHALDTTLGAPFLPATGVKYVQSWVLKAAGYNYVAVLTVNPSQSRYFDIVNGTVLGNYSAMPDDAWVDNLGDGWFRVNIVVTTTLSTGVKAALYLSETGSSLLFTGNGTSGIYACRASLKRYFPVNPNNFHRRRTSGGQLVGIDRVVQYKQPLLGTRLTQAQTFTTEKAL